MKTILGNSATLCMFRIKSTLRVAIPNAFRGVNLFRGNKSSSHRRNTYISWRLNFLLRNK